MRQKNTLFIAISISVSIFLIALCMSLYGYLKKMELRFNERKAALIKENLDLKDDISSLKELLAQKKEALALLREEEKSIKDRLNGFEQEKKALEAEYKEEILALKRDNASLNERLKGTGKKTLTEHIEEAAKKEKDKKLKEFLKKVVYNIELIKKGGDIELEPIVVTKKQEQQKEKAAHPPESRLQKKSSLLPGERGKIVSVDEKYSLVVLNLGRRDGLRKGRQCIILKDEKEAASAEVVSVRYRVSAAFVYETGYGYDIRDIKKGDGVLVIKNL